VLDILLKTGVKGILQSECDLKINTLTHEQDTLEDTFTGTIRYIFQAPVLQEDRRNAEKYSGYYCASCHVKQD
jgi:hypothetical protein